MNLKAEYLKLMNTPIKWEICGEKIFGLVNSAAIFEISLGNDFDYQVKTFYPGVDASDLNFSNDDGLDFVKMVCDERYRSWLKNDFIKVNSGV